MKVCIWSLLQCLKLYFNGKHNLSERKNNMAKINILQWLDKIFWVLLYFSGPSPGETRGSQCSGPHPHGLELLSQNDRARVTAQWRRLAWLLPRFGRFSWVTVSPFAVCSWDNFQRLQMLVSKCSAIMPLSLEMRYSELLKLSSWRCFSPQYKWSHNRWPGPGL